MEIKNRKIDAGNRKSEKCRRNFSTPIKENKTLLKREVLLDENR